MNSRKDRSFCLWVVPPNDGRVRKLRFTRKRFAIAACFLLLMVGTFVYLAGDYSRVQILRAKSFLTLKRVDAEKRKLESNQNVLKAEVADLRSVNHEVVQYQLNVKQRLEELRDLLRSASSLGVLDEEELPTTVSKDGAGIGGAELDCEGNRCEGEFKEASLTRYIGQDSVNFREEDLVSLLDHYISLVRRIPFATPGNGHVNSGFGPRRSPFSRKIRMHQGLDFSLSSGSYIFSTADGVVKSVKRTATYGLVIDVSHGEGVTTRYAHLSRALVKAGDSVCRSEAIGLVGSTGRSTGPHLHYEIRIDGKPVNPVKFIEFGKKLVRWGF